MQTEKKSSGCVKMAVSVKTPLDEREYRAPTLKTEFEYNIVDIALWVLLLISFIVVFCEMSSLASFNVSPGQIWYRSQSKLDLYQWYAKVFNYGD